MVYAADEYLRKFLGLPSLREPGISINRNYEDPTYPIFHIKFYFGNPPESKHPDFVTNRLLDQETNPESAVRYLYDIGEPKRAKMLTEFIRHLENISNNTPWYFQEINGLENLHSLDYLVNSTARSEGVDLTINTLDSIDLRITALKDLYRKAVYDRKFNRWVLPVNLRRFRMSILVGEFRQMAINEDNFSINARQAVDTLRDIDVFNASNIGGKLLGRVNDGAIRFVKRLQWWDNHFSCVLYDCQDCEFDMFEQSYYYNTSMKHSDLGRSQLGNKFKIKVGRVLETNTYSLLKYIISDNNLNTFISQKDDDNTFATVSKQSEQLQGAFKPVYPTWKNYQSLEREKGDNKRVLFENRGVEGALNSAVNEGLNFLGVSGILGGGTNLGTAAGFIGNSGLGSVVDFVTDSISELAQEALSLATEQVTKNIFDNSIASSIAGGVLGVLNGDLNAVAQNLSNPALAGALGINVESSGRAVPPNLRDGIPTNLNLEAPSVQRSLSDIRANLTGEEGIDPRFQSIGRPGESLFANPNPLDKVLEPQNLGLQSPRVETEMPINVEFQDGRKETSLNPNNIKFQDLNVKKSLDENNVNLEGSGKKTNLDSVNANLTGAQPITDLTPSNADLTGAQPIKDLNPSNADLTGAQPIKDLNPSNADLTGAQPIKDLNPSNADLTGAQPITDLTPSNADLTGAQPIKDLNPSNADLTGAQPIKDLNPSNADLTGAQPITDLTPSNADLTGAQPIKDLNPSNADLTGAQPITDLTPSNADLTGAQPITDLSPSNADLIGAGALTDLNPSNADLTGANALRDLTQTNADLTGAQPITDLSPSNADLIGAGALTELNPSNADLTGANALRDLTQTNADLIGAGATIDLTQTNADLTGANALRDLTQTNAELIGAGALTDLNSSNADLIGAGATRDLTQTNADLTGASALRGLTQTNADLTGANALRDLTQTNADLTGANALRDLTQTNADLTGAEATRDLTQTNADLIGAGSSRSLTQINADLTGAGASRGLTQINADLTGAGATRDLTQNNADLIGSGASRGLTQTNADLTGASALRGLTQINADLTGAGASRGLTQTNADLTGASALRGLTQTNADLTGAGATRDLTQTNADLTGYKTTQGLKIENLELNGSFTTTVLNKSVSLEEPYTTRDFNETEINLQGSIQQEKVLGTETLLGSIPKLNFENDNVNFEGSISNPIVPNNVEFNSTEISYDMQKNVEFETKSDNSSITYNQTSLGNAYLSDESAGKNTILNPSNVNLEGNQPIQTTMKNINLENSQPLGVMQTVISLIDTQTKMDDDEK